MQKSLLQHSLTLKRLRCGRFDPPTPCAFPKKSHLLLSISLKFLRSFKIYRKTPSLIRVKLFRLSRLIKNYCIYEIFVDQLTSTTFFLVKFEFEYFQKEGARVRLKITLMFFNPFSLVILE